MDGAAASIGGIPGGTGLYARLMEPSLAFETGVICATIVRAQYRKTDITPHSNKHRMLLTHSLFFILAILLLERVNYDFACQTRSIYNNHNWGGIVKMR